MMRLLLMLLLVGMAGNTLGDGNGTRILLSQRYPDVKIGPVSWEYFRVELPPAFSTVTISLTKNKWTSEEKAPLMCFRFGGPPLPSKPVDGLELAISMAGRAQNSSSTGYCAWAKNNFHINVTNKEITSGLFYSSIFSEPGSSRTQSTMINRGATYSSEIQFIIAGCQGRVYSGGICGAYITPLVSSNHDSENGRLLSSCGVRWTFFVLDILEFSSLLQMAVNDTRENLTLFARHAALPREDLYDFISEPGSTSLRIERPKLGTWYIGVLAPIPSNLETCFSIRWNLQACPSDRAGTSCQWPSIDLQRILIKPRESPIDSNYFPIGAQTKSKWSSFALPKNETMGAERKWIHFRLEIPPATAGSVFSMEVRSSSLSSIEVYSRLNGYPTDNDWDFRYNSSKSEDLTLDMVYPAEGVWVFGILYSLNHDLAVEDEASLKLQASLHGCLKSCSDSGSCSTSYDASRLSYFSFCRCDRTHGGIDCSETLLSLSEKRIQSWALILSNAAAVLPSLWALRHKAYSEWLVYTTSGISSAIYHSCDAGGWCALPYDTLQFLDFWLSFLAVVFTCIYLVEVLDIVKTTLHIGAAIITAIIAKSDRTSTRSIVLVIGLGATGLLFGVGLEFWRHSYGLQMLWRRSMTFGLKERTKALVTRLRNRFIWAYLGIGILIVVFAGFCFSLEKAKTYWIWHSLWHVCIYSGAFFLLFSIVEEAREPDTPTGANNAEMQVFMVNDH